MLCAIQTTMAAGCKHVRKPKNIRDMKSLKIWSLAVLLLVTMVGCKNKSGDEQKIGGFDKIEQEWKLVSVNGVDAEFNIYISFSSGMFALYQQAFTVDYKFYDGEYHVSGDTLSGSYFEGGDWKCDYTGGITEDGKTMTLKSKEEHPITCVYEACTIPEEVKEEATGTRAVDAIPFL